MATSLAAGPLPWLQSTMQMLIAGEPVDAISGETYPDVNPADGSLLTRIAAGDAADVAVAVSAARDAFRAGPWATIGPDRRSRICWRLAELVEEHADELALLDTLDSGKPLIAARRIDIVAAAQMIRYWAGWPARIEGRTMPLSLRGDFHAYTRREPLGVVGVIVPWNAPALFVAWKAVAAIACGNTVVVKPADETPLSALRIAGLALEAGLPPGVLNVVTGSGETAGSALAAHPDVDKVAFTGSVQTARLVVQAALGNMKKVSLELGGKSPNVVMGDADLSHAIPGAANAIFFNQGCVCAAGSRLYVHESVFDEVLDGVAGAAQRIRLGAGVEPSTTMGPLVSRAQQDRVASLVDSGLQAGAQAVTGGRRADRDGFFYEPTVMTGCDRDMRVAREEIFGPVVLVSAFTDLEQAIALANDTVFGLAAGIWTRDLSNAHRFAAAVRAGTIWVNTYNVVDPALPFGGFGQSGWGRDLGQEAVDLYTETKSVAIRLG